MKVQIDPSGRAACSRCKNKIQKGTKRLEVITGSFRGNVQKKRYCSFCALTILNLLLEEFYEDDEDEVCNEE